MGSILQNAGSSKRIRATEMVLPILRVGPQDVLIFGSFRVRTPCGSGMPAAPNRHSQNEFCRSRVGRFRGPVPEATAFTDGIEGNHVYGVIQNKTAGSSRMV